MTKLHKFDDEITIKTEKQPNGEFTAIDADNYDLGSPVGWGFSEFSAIANLFEQLPRAESEREDRLAAQRDHSRDLRKHG